MTKQLFCFTLFLLICPLISGIAAVEIVDIPGANLRTAIEQALGKAAGATITVTDMQALTQLNARQSNTISDIHICIICDMIPIFTFQPIYPI